MEQARRKKSGLIGLIILLLVLMAAGFYFLMPPQTYRVAIVPDNAARSVVDGKLTFRYQWPQGMVRQSAAAYACACFKDSKNPPSIVSCSGNNPKLESQCTGYIKVVRRGDDYQPYQAHRQMILPVFQGAILGQDIAGQKPRLELDLKPDKQGEMQIHKLYINGVAFDKYMMRRFGTSF
jgi:hypothetical protein